MDLESEAGLKGDDLILAEAKRRFGVCEDWESTPRKLFIDDVKFANGDSDNNYQWPNDIHSLRDTNDRPCLTINKTRQHNLQIINDAKQNKPGVIVRPTGDGATYDSAQCFEDVVRHIEYISNATVAYDTAVKFQVEGGIGYWRVVTDYIGDGSFDQEIFIRRIKNPLTVYQDPDINEVDGSDARFTFVFDDLPKEEFNRLYPEYKDKASMDTLGNTGDDGWLGAEKVRIAEYYRRVAKSGKMMAFKHPTSGQDVMMKESQLPPEIAQMVMDEKGTKIRSVTEWTVEWYLIVGNTIVERNIWPGIYIPIVRIIGEETIIDGQLDRKGHTRALKDPQRMYNYHSSAAVEFVALQSKSPYIAPAQSIEGYEEYYSTANTQNHAVLPYNHLDDDGNVMAAPERAQPPVAAQGYSQLIEMSRQEMMMVSGQYEATMGQKSNEVSGKAINERQRQGDTATYHYIDNEAIGIRFTGKILIDLIPKVYDTARVLRIRAEDGTEREIEMDPNQRQAYFEKRNEEGEIVKQIFNPKVGRYDVEADVGPGYATKRQEAFNAFSQIATQSPELMNLAGDLMFLNADFPGADEIAKRLKNMVPQQALGNKGPDPQLMQAQQESKSLQLAVETLTRQLAEAKLKAADKSNDNLVNEFKALTDRWHVALEHLNVPKAQSAQMLHDMMMAEHQVSLQPEPQLPDAALPSMQEPQATGVGQ